MGEYSGNSPDEIGSIIESRKNARRYYARLLWNVLIPCLGSILTLLLRATRKYHEDPLVAPHAQRSIVLALVTLMLGVAAIVVGSTGDRAIASVLGVVGALASVAAYAYGMRATADLA